MDPLEEGTVHQAIPQGTTDPGAQTSEEVQMAKVRPLTNDQRKIHMRLGDVIPGTGVMRAKEEIIPASRAGEKIRSPYQGAMILRRDIQETPHQWPQRSMSVVKSLEGFLRNQDAIKTNLMAVLIPG